MRLSPPGLAVLVAQGSPCVWLAVVEAHNRDNVRSARRHPVAVLGTESSLTITGSELRSLEQGGSHD